MDIWTVPLDSERPLLLVGIEQERAARFRRERDRIRWARARSALRQTLGSYLGCGPLDLRFTYGPHGKPSIENAPELRFNLSHSGDWAMIAVARGGIEVGVDIEHFRENVDIAALLRRVGERDVPDTGTVATIELYRRWARREAASKTSGDPLLRKVDPLVCLADVDAPEGYAAAVGMMAFRPEPVYCG